MIAIEDLAPGKVVRLISGSPKMTVTRIQASPEPLVSTVFWSEARSEFLEATFVPALLIWPASTRAAEGGKPE